jgi:hypothetical protein
MIALAKPTAPRMFRMYDPSIVYNKGFP